MSVKFIILTFYEAYVDLIDPYIYNYGDYTVI